MSRASSLIENRDHLEPTLLSTAISWFAVEFQSQLTRPKVNLIKYRNFGLAYFGHSRYRLS